MGYVCVCVCVCVCVHVCLRLHVCGVCTCGVVRGVHMTLAKEQEPHYTSILLTSNVHDHNGWYKFSHNRQYKARDRQ